MHFPLSRSEQGNAVGGFALTFQLFLQDIAKLL